MLTPTNPSTGQALAPHASLSATDIENALQSANGAFSQWRARRYEERAEVLYAAARAMREHKDALADLMAIEMGKPFKEGVAEVEKSAWCAEYYAQHAAEFLAKEVLESDASCSYVQYPPLGVVLGILPWNAPVWLALRFLAPALMAGNCCVMKHDPNVPGSAALLTELFHKAGLGDGIMTNLPITTEQVGEVIDHPLVRAVSFTGSSEAGRKVAARAAAGLKPAVLELGGSDPCIVMADADLEKAADVVTLSRMINAGQSCIAAKRIFIEASVYPAFCALLVERFEAIKMGDPRSADTALGPLARTDLRAQLHRQVGESLALGANVLTGGALPDTPGFYYPPTLLADVKPGMPVFDEETFGPVLAVAPVSGIDEALALANATDYGLGASLWTHNAETIDRALATLEAGQVAVNGIVKTDPRLPSGGIGRSGYGRELGPHGIREFVNTQQIWIA